jgi:hypothetical protein
MTRDKSHTKHTHIEGPKKGPFCFCDNLTVITRGANLIKCVDCGALFYEIFDHGDGVATYFKIKIGDKQNENSDF